MQSKEVQKSKFSNNGTLSPQKRLNQARADAKRFYGLTLEDRPRDSRPRRNF